MLLTLTARVHNMEYSMHVSYIAKPLTILHVPHLIAIVLVAQRHIHTQSQSLLDIDNQTIIRNIIRD